MERDILWGLSVSFGLLLGYLGGYFKRKAENRAIKEDIAALTRSVEEIKATLADKSRDRRQWKMKRDAMLAMLQSAGLATEALMHMAGTYQQGRAGKLRLGDWVAMANKLSRTWLEKMDEYDQRSVVASFLGGDELESALRVTHRSMRKLAQAAMKGLPYDMDTDMAAIRAEVATVRNIVRRELGLEHELPDRN